jgi:hypothetical protein
MKKIIVVLVLIMSMSTQEIKASQYMYFQNIHFETRVHKFLHNFSEYEMNKYLNRVDDRKFWGWSTYEVTNHQKVYFQKETLLKIENQGTTSIKQSYTLKVSEQSKVQFDTRGSITTKTKGKIKGLDFNLDAKLDISYAQTTTTNLVEETKINIEVDPMTKLKVAIYGEGYITNGVGRYFRFFREIREGGYEVFILATEYYGIEKTQIS